MKKNKITELQTNIEDYQNALDDLCYLITKYCGQAREPINIRKDVALLQELIDNENERRQRND